MVPEYLGAIPGGHTQGNSRGLTPLTSLSQAVFPPQRGLGWGRGTEYSLRESLWALGLGRGKPNSQYWLDY